MRMERRGHAEFDSFDRKVRQGGMIKPSVNLQELRRRIYRKAKAEKQWRFWGLYVHVTKTETLTAAYQEAKANDGSPGIDGESFQSIEIRGVGKFLGDILRELHAGRYKPSKNRRVEIPKGNGKTRRLGIPTIKDRVVQGALKLILEPIFEADFHQSSFAYRVIYTRYADDMVVLVDGYPQWRPHVCVIKQRMEEELKK